MAAVADEVGEVGDEGGGKPEVGVTFQVQALFQFNESLFVKFHTVLVCVHIVFYSRIVAAILSFFCDFIQSLQMLSQDCENSVLLIK